MRHAISISLGAALVVLASVPGHANPAAGKAVFEGNQCQTCHYTEGPARETSISDQLAKKGPELWYAGSKFQRPWLESWLQDPQPIRPLKYNSLSEKNSGDHAKLSAGDAATVTEFLMSLKSDIVQDLGIEPKKNLKGRRVFLKKAPCAGCHKFPNRRKGTSGGLTGPSLVGARERLNLDWIYAYLKDPVAFKPIRAMPVFNEKLSEKDILNLAIHVANFK